MSNIHQRLAGLRMLRPGNVGQKAWNELLAAVGELPVTSFHNGIFQSGAGGTRLAANAPAQPSPSSGLFPFNLYKVDAAHVAVRPAFARWFNTDYQPQIDGTSIFAQPPPAIEITETTNIYLKSVLTEGEDESFDGVTSVEIIADPTAPESMDNSGATQYLWLGAVTFSGGAITAVSSTVFSSIAFVVCGNTVIPGAV